MTLIIALGLCVLGIVGLTTGGEALVRGAVALARRTRISPAVIGLTIVAFATSLPELVVSVFAALQDSTDVALGNVVGSNIANVGLILGLSAVIQPLPVYGNAVRVEWPFMFLASCVAVVMGWYHSLTRPEGVILLVLLIGFNWITAWHASRPGSDQGMAGISGEVDLLAQAPWQRRLPVQLGMVAGGCLLLVLGGRALVTGAVTLAQLANISERVIGLTVVAIGTSLPELATSLIAARHGHTDMAVANVIGSNIFNILGVLGTVALIHPIPIPNDTVIDMVWMLGFSLAIFPMMHRDFRVSRREGGVLLTGYAVYLFTLI